jgi:hypothetical protein
MASNLSLKVQTMTNKKDGSDIENNSYSEMELFDSIFSEEIDDATEKPSRKSLSLNDRIKDIIVRFFNYIKNCRKQNASDAEINDITCKLNIVSGPMKGHSFKIKEEVTFIGRSQENDIVINDQTLSRRHIKITKNNNNFFIQDLGSHNGLMVDGKRVIFGKDIELMDGVVCSVGDSVFSIEKIYAE